MPLQDNFARSVKKGVLTGATAIIFVSRVAGNLAGKCRCMFMT